MIQLIFSRGATEVELKHVRTVEWESVAVPEVIVGTASRVGKRQRLITIRGFFNLTMFQDTVAAQQALETNLRSVGVGTLSYTGATDFEDVRFQALSFDEYRGNPVADFTITFTTEEDNVHAHIDNKIGSITLTPVNGYEQPSIKDAISVQGDDEQLNNLRRRSFTITGDIVGADLEAVMLAQADLVAEVENKNTVVITVSSTTSTPGSFTVRPRSLNFDSPRLKDDKTARSYSFECVTHDDYTKEPYTLGEVPQSFAGISIDVVNGVDHNVDRERSDVGPLYSVLEETLVVTGKKYFADWTAYTAFRNIFLPIPANTYITTSGTSNVLELTDIDVGKFERDGNQSSGDKRYSATVILTFTWLKSIQDTNFEFLQTHFGVSWYKVESVSFSVSFDDFGNLNTRSVNVSGSLTGLAQFDQLKAKVGTKVDYDGVYTDLYVTNVSINNVDSQIVSGTKVKIISVSVTASQLDTASQAFHFLSGVFDFAKAGAGGTTYSTETLTFDKITNRTKSFSNRYDGANSEFKVTSINFSVSGEVFSSDTAGAPTDADKYVILFNKIDSLLKANKSDAVKHTQTPTQLLPTDGAIHFMLTNINIGGWEPFIDEATGVRRWKQTVSLSATAVFDLAGSSDTAPDFVETRSESIDEEVPKYTQLQVLGFGTVFKRIGTTPEKLTVTYQVRWKNEALYELDNAAGLNFKSDNVGEGSWRGAGKNNKSKDRRENRALTNRHIVEYTANDKLS